MNIELLEIDQTDQLSACRLSLLLGISDEPNLIKRFLKFGQKLISTQYAIFCFHHECYFWHYAEDKIHAIIKTQDLDNDNCCGSELFIDDQHNRYVKFSEYMGKTVIEHKRILAVNIKKGDNESMGLALFFDDQLEPFDSMRKELLVEHCVDFANFIELKLGYEHLNDLYEQERALNFSKTKFFSIISHDLRAPFHGLLGFSEVLAKERQTLDESSIQNIADYLYETSQSTYNLLESLLNWAMAEGGRFAYHPVHFKIKQATAIVVNVLHSFALKKNIQLIEDVPENIQVYADINMITSVIQNLVSNALKFTQVDGSGKVYIQVRQTASTTEISVRDTGRGMTDLQMKDVFQPRMTVSLKGTDGEKGAGLGLSLCKRFVDLNLGEISVSSIEGKGTTFKVSLPNILENIPNIVKPEADLEEVKVV